MNNLHLLKQLITIKATLLRSFAVELCFNLLLFSRDLNTGAKTMEVSK